MQRRSSKNIQSPDLSQTKVTPRTRPAHEAGHDGQLIKPDPDKKYVLVSREDWNPMNVDYYISQGYDMEICTPDGVRVRMGEKPVVGSPLGWRGMTLMSCSKERAEEIFQFGPSGNTGQAYMDKLMAKIRKDPSSQDIVRKARGLRLEEYDVSDDSDLANNTFR